MNAAQRTYGQFAGRHWLLLVAVTLLAVSVSLRVDVFGQIGYLVERGRLRALREVLPNRSELAAVSGLTRQVAATVGPSVVQIETLATVHRRRMHKPPAPTGGNQLLPPRDSHDDRSLIEESVFSTIVGVGSGFVFDAAKGYLLTNEHVIRDAETIRVRLSDGRTYQAEVVGADIKTDLAVLRIKADRLHQIPLGDSRLMEIGDDVLAVGSPFGHGVSFSRGIISARGREGSRIVIADVEYRGFLQTDAVINPGNSGGPLVNMGGEVIGINMAIASRTGSFEGVGFAIPSDRVRRLLPQLIDGGKVVRGYLGVEIRSVMSDRERALKSGWDRSYGVIVAGVIPDSPAAGGGIQTGDIIVSLADQDTPVNTDLLDAVAFVRPGTEVTIRIWRDGAFQDRRVRIAEQPSGFHTHPSLGRLE